MPDDNIPTIDVEEMPTIDLGDQPESPQLPQTPTSSIGVPPSGIAQTLRDFESDFRYGGGLTMAGRLLQKLGARGINVGSQASAGDFIASTPLGLTHAAQGVAEKSPLKVAGGLLEASQLPASFVGPPVAEAMTPAATVARAGSKMAQFEQAAGRLSLNASGSADSALRAFELSQRGQGTLPTVIRNFLRRISGPDQPPMTIQEARDFASSASKVSTKEYEAMGGKLRAQIRQFAGALHDDIAVSSGRAQQYYDALRAYSRAKGYESAASGLKDAVIKELKYAAGGAAAGAGFYGVGRAVKK